MYIFANFNPFREICTKNNRFCTLYNFTLYFFTFYIRLISTPKHLEIALTFCFFCVKTKERGIRTHISCNTHGLQIRAIGVFCTLYIIQFYILHNINIHAKAFRNCLDFLFLLCQDKRRKNQNTYIL